MALATIQAKSHQQKKLDLGRESYDICNVSDRIRGLRCRCGAWRLLPERAYQVDRRDGHYLDRLGNPEWCGGHPPSRSLCVKYFIFAVDFPSSPQRRQDSTSFLPLAVLPQPSLQKAVSLLPDCQREFMTGLRLSGHQPVAGLKHLVVDLTGCRLAILDSRDFKITVPHRSVDKNRPWRQSRQDLGKIKGHTGWVFRIDVGYARHVALVAPPGQVTPFIFRKGVESATCHHGLHTRIKSGKIQRVMAAQRMPDDSDFIGVD